MKILFILSLNLSILLSQDLFFSEYIEGSRYNKALEIFNPANTDIDLTGYEVWKVTNSVGNWIDENGDGSYALDLSTIVLPAKDVLVICHTLLLIPIMILFWIRIQIHLTLRLR